MFEPGFLDGSQVIALRPLTVSSDDYALREYGVTEGNSVTLCQALTPRRGKEH